QPFVWTAASDTGGNVYPVRISSAGIAADTGINVSTSFDAMGIARSLADDAACIATAQNVFVSGTTFDYTVKLYRVLPGAAAVLVDSRVIPYTGLSGGSSYSLRFVAASRKPGGGEMC